MGLLQTAFGQGFGKTAFGWGFGKTAFGWGFGKTAFGWGRTALTTTPAATATAPAPTALGLILSWAGFFSGAGGDGGGFAVILRCLGSFVNRCRLAVARRGFGASMSTTAAAAALFFRRHYDLLIVAVGWRKRFIGGGSNGWHVRSRLSALDTVIGRHQGIIPMDQNVHLVALLDGQQGVALLIEDIEGDQGRNMNRDFLVAPSYAFFLDRAEYMKRRRFD